MARAVSPFGRVLLVTGPEALLAERAVDKQVALAAKERPDADRHDIEALHLDAARLGELAGASLFASSSIAVVRDVGSLPAELIDHLVALAADPPEDVALVLVHAGGQKGRGLLDKLKKTKPEIIDNPLPKPKDLLRFVHDEAKAARVRIPEDAAQFLIDAVGHDLRALAAAVSQLAADRMGDEEVSIELVRRYFGGRAEVSSFAVTDEILAGRTVRALEQLRWALDTGTAPVLVTSALAAGLRGLGKLQANRSGMGDNDLARDIGVPPWKIRSMRVQLRGWDARGLAAAIQHVAQADADVKGAADDADYALERCLLAVVGCRRA
ncbi:DNA polymerase III subunit delta [Granulicoccus sp. GXG6511]|uniref:DNA polymerase III subunit delta n=1 Tax=Granulicoccus sp. GXG6511 TaxID=3381351 RepID=UPI003D7ECF4B